MAPCNGLRLCVFANDVQAQFDTFGTDVHIGSCDNLVHFRLGFVAERAGEAGWVGILGHIFQWLEPRIE